MAEAYYFPLNDDQPKGYRSSSFVHFACYPDPQEKGSGAAANIILPMPQSFTVNDGFNYGTVDLGNLEREQLEDGGFGNFVDSSARGLVGGIENALRSAGGGITNINDLRTQKVVNPNTHTMFEGVNMREFTFSFNLVPRNKADADAIKIIRDTFQRYAYPEDTQEIGAQGPLSMFRRQYKFPAIWDVSIVFQQNGEINRFVPQIFEESYITSISQVINPEANTFHINGEPTAITLSINIREARTLTRSSIQTLQNAARQ